MFNLLGDAEAAEYFSRMSVASHGGERDTGHTGNFFNMLWAMPGVALSGPHATGAWMKEFGWYYDLARRWDGTYLHQGPPDAEAGQLLGAGTAPAPICSPTPSRSGRLHSDREEGERRRADRRRHGGEPRRGRPRLEPQARGSPPTPSAPTRRSSPA